AARGRAARTHAGGHANRAIALASPHRLGFEALRFGTATVLEVPRLGRRSAAYLPKPVPGAGIVSRDSAPEGFVLRCVRRGGRGSCSAERRTPHGTSG